MRDCTSAWRQRPRREPHTWAPRRDVAPAVRDPTTRRPARTDPYGRDSSTGCGRVFDRKTEARTILRYRPHRHGHLVERQLRESPMNLIKGGNPRKSTMQVGLTYRERSYLRGESPPPIPKARPSPAPEMTSCPGVKGDALHRATLTNLCQFLRTTCSK
jgi:hypothetical protein